MSDHIHESAKRKRSNSYHSDQVLGDMQRDLDNEILATAYLADHQPDDGEPLTPEQADWIAWQLRQSCKGVTRGDVRRIMEKLEQS